MGGTSPLGLRATASGREGEGVRFEKRRDLAAKRREPGGLGDEGIGAARHRQLLCLLIVESGHRQDPDGLGRRRVLHPAAHLEAVDPGHAQIEHEQMGLERADPKERFVATADTFDSRSEISEAVHEQIDEVLPIVDDEDFRITHLNLKFRLDTAKIRSFSNSRPDFGAKSIFLLNCAT